MNELHDKYSLGKCTEGFDKLWNLAQEHDLNSNSDQTWAAVKRGFKQFLCFEQFLKEQFVASLNQVF